MGTPQTIKIDEVEYVRADSVAPMPSYHPTGDTGPWAVGKQWLIRTVTMLLHGTLIDVTDKELVLAHATWIPDSGRWANFVAGGVMPNENEPFPPEKIVVVNRGALIDAVQLDGKFKSQK